MLFYNIWALIKIIVWSLTIFYLYNYVNVFQDPTIWLAFWFLWIFLVVWGISFYIFYIFSKFFSQKPNITIASKSYKTSLLFGLYILINIALIVLENWTKLLWLLIFVIFVVLQLLTVNEND